MLPSGSKILSTILICLRTCSLFLSSLEVGLNRTQDRDTRKTPDQLKGSKYRQPTDKTRRWPPCSIQQLSNTCGEMGCIQNRGRIRQARQPRPSGEPFSSTCGVGSLVSRIEYLTKRLQTGQLFEDSKLLRRELPTYGRTFGNT